MEGNSSGLILCSRLDAMPSYTPQKGDYLLLKAVIFERYHGFAVVSDRCK